MKEAILKQKAERDRLLACDYQERIASLIECAKELKVNKLLIITWDQDETIEKNGYTIEVIPVRNWTGR